jgi:hypothetical protein
VAFLAFLLPSASETTELALSDITLSFIFLFLSPVENSPLPSSLERFEQTLPSKTGSVVTKPGEVLSN